jgi:hypothetical protein
MKSESRGMPGHGRSGQFGRRVSGDTVVISGSQASAGGPPTLAAREAQTGKKLGTDSRKMYRHRQRYRPPLIGAAPSTHLPLS